MTDHDPVNKPAHYTQYDGIEVIQLTEQMSFNRGNAVKYIARAGFKDADKELEDLNKAAWYLAREIERVGKVAEKSAAALRALSDALIESEGKMAQHQAGENKVRGPRPEDGPDYLADKAAWDSIDKIRDYTHGL